MKFAYGSDLHLEFGINEDAYTQTDAEVLLLAGDVCEIARRENFVGWFETINNKFNDIFLIAGNHEYYDGHFKESLEDWQAFLSQFDNFHFLDMQAGYVGDVKILGTTLWTPLPNPVTEFNISRRMNDYRLIGRGEIDVDARVMYEGSLRTSDTKEEHARNREWLIDELGRTSPDQKTIVMSHHCPSEMSITPKHRSSDLNDAYVCNDMEQVFLENHIDKWIHGHTHGQLDYDLHGTNVLCNAQGYVGRESCADGWKLKEFEL